MPRKSKVSVNWQTLFVFIPFLNIWTAWRIQKLKRAALIFIPINFFAIIVFRLTIKLSSDSGDELVLFTLTMLTVGIVIVNCNLMIYLIRKWSIYWNKQVASVTS